MVTLEVSTLYFCVSMIMDIDLELSVRPLGIYCLLGGNKGRCSLLFIVTLFRCKGTTT